MAYVEVYFDWDMQEFGHKEKGMESKWWTLGDLNPRPPGCKPGALPS